MKWTVNDIYDILAVTGGVREGMGAFYSVVYPSKAFHAVNGYALRRRYPPRMYSFEGNPQGRARFLNRKSRRRYRLKFADSYYGELNHYGMYWLKWADVRAAELTGKNWYNYRQQFAQQRKEAMP